jgi:polyphenol oxidase
MAKSLQFPVIEPRSFVEGVHTFATTRLGGVSQGRFSEFNLGTHVGDDAKIVWRNRQMLLQALPSEPLWLDQVHGTVVIDADSAGDSSTPSADASYTMTPGRVLAILTADCLPVVIADRSGTIVGVAHAGWRGLHGGVLQALVAAMRQRVGLGADVADGRGSTYCAWLGPCIGPQSFQVGQDVYDAFVALQHDFSRFFRADVSAPQKWHCDLPGLATMILKSQGVDSVVWSGDCTVLDSTRFFSYRRQGQTGRMATLAWLGQIQP